MQAAHNETSLQPMSVNVRLCGSIPRKDLTQTGAPCSLKGCLTSSNALRPCFATTNGPNEGSTLRKSAICEALQGFLSHSNSLESMRAKQNAALGPVLEPPSWAVPAKGEARLEPVCEAFGRQSPVDLTTKACFRIGRSPNSDVQLFHATSSRRHAMIFHHSNGSCYIVDCGSAHGTFVNGSRIPCPSKNGLVVPHKVRRGALIRFGGPGAPSFLLKSFSFSLSDIRDVASSPDMGELVRRNTRLNALGSTAVNSIRGSTLVRTIQSALAVSRKRSFDSLDSADSLHCAKRPRCSSPPLGTCDPPRLVSPELTVTVRKRVTFADDPQLCFPALVTPEVLSSDEDDA